MDDMIYFAAGIIAIPFLLTFGGASVSVIVLVGKAFEFVRKKVFGD